MSWKRHREKHKWGWQWLFPKNPSKLELSPAGKQNSNPSPFLGREHREIILINSIFIQLFDDEGKNVTPHPLFQPDPNAAVTRQENFLFKYLICFSDI